MHRMLNSFLILTLLFGLHTTASALASDSQKAYQVNSQSVLYNRNRHQTTYTGNVTAKQGTTLVSGDKLLIINSPTTGDVTEIIAYGKQAHYSTLPDKQTQKLYAQANTIKYWPKRGKVLLISDGKITQKHNVFTGQLIWYDINKQTVLSGSGSESRTTIVIQPQHTAGKQQNS